MLMELKDAFLFLMDIFKGKLPLHDLYLLVFIIVVTSIAETIQEKENRQTGVKTPFLYI
ncbi:hypothetical protein AAHH67_06215 [Niallia circulans]